MTRNCDPGALGNNVFFYERDFLFVIRMKMIDANDRLDTAQSNRIEVRDEILNPFFEETQILFRVC